MTTEHPDADLSDTQSELLHRQELPTPTNPIHRALASGGDLRAAAAQALGISEEEPLPRMTAAAPGGGSSDDEDEDGSSDHEPPRSGRVSRGEQGETKPSAADRRQMFRMIQSYYKSDSEKFHGRDEENVEEFLETYESLFTVAGMPLSLASEMFPYVLTGTAKDFLRMRSQGMAWTALRKLFLHQYASTARRQRLAQRYQGLRQLTASGIDAYYRQLIEVTRQLPSAYRMPDLMRDKFLSGLHESIREAVTLVDPPNLQAAYDRAKMVVQARRASSPTSSRVPRRAPWRRPPAGHGKPLQERRGTLVVTQNTRKAPEDVICWECGERGHYSSIHRNGTWKGRKGPNTDSKN